MKKPPTEHQLDEYQNLYKKLTNSDNRVFCLGLLKDHGIQVAINYARVILNPIFKRRARV